MEEHKCPGEHLFTVENRGDGWYLYKGDKRGAQPTHYCIYCGEKLTKKEGGNNGHCL